ncbi:MAG TPA: hypothetical protein VNQ90_08640 [Chthoniobacteraceae bacterium]|nr:hypothetical protein [Chthoniobacteraceae bacterium]
MNTDPPLSGTNINSSTAELRLPTGATVLWAGLYWGANTQVANDRNQAAGDINSSVAKRDEIMFKVPGGSYQTLSASVVDFVDVDTSVNYGKPYSCFVDITGKVQQAGNGVYAAGNVLAARGVNRYAVWTMVVVYQAPGLTPKNLTVFDGFKVVRNVTGSTTVNIPISGFHAPPTGPVDVKLGVMSYEGDLGYDGDQLKMGPTTGNLYAVSDALNPANNFANSSITYLGHYAGPGDPGFPKLPNFKNQLGVDADIMAAPQGAVQNNGESAVIQFTSSYEAYYPAVLTTAIELYAPQVKAKKDFLDVNGDNVTPGDIITYTIEFENRPDTEVNGDATKDTVLEDVLPEQVTYVPGSLKVVRVGTTDQVDLTDAGDGDEGEVVPEGNREKIIVRLGHPYDPPNHDGSGTPGGVGTTGGVVKQGEKTIVSFDVRVKLGTQDGVKIINEANIGYNSLAKGIAFVASVIPATVTNSKVITGVVFEDVNYGGGPGRGPLQVAGAAGTLTAPAGAVPVPGARVELYGPETGDPNGTKKLLDVATTDAEGIYTFKDINNTGPTNLAKDYVVRIVSETVKSTRGAATGLLPVQTYRTETELVPSPDGDLSKVIPILDKVGGENPAVADAPANMNMGTALPANAQNISSLTVTGADLLRVDFGFNFDTVVNTNASGQGSLAQVIANANNLHNDTALAQANHPPGLENVVFNFPAGTSFPATIATGATPLPTITERLYLDASIQNGVQNSSGTPQVYLDGSGTTGNGFGFVGPNASNSLVKNFAIGNFNGHGMDFTSSDGHQIKGNWIGLTPTQAAAGNHGSGIYINASSNNVIGGGNNGEANVIAHNGATNQGGVFIQNGTGNTISRNSIFRNKGLGIDLTAAGVNGNDGSYGSGANSGVDYPVFTSIDLASGTVAGHVGAAGGSSVYSGATVEVFVSDDDGDQNGPVYAGDGLNLPHGEGKTYLGSLSVGGDGKFSGSVNLGGHAALTATTTYQNSTSEFGPNEAIGATLSGVVYEDLNLNNQYDAAPTPEPGPGTEHPLFAKLINESAPTVAVQTVAVDPATGAYSFAGLPPGTYTIVISLDGDDANNVTPAYPAGWGGRERPTGQQTGIVVQLVAIPSLNFGFSLQSNLTGRVFLDTGVSGQAGTANNGSLDGGEAGIASVPITLLINGTPSGDPVTTGPDGTFSVVLPANLAENDNIQLVQAEIPQHLSTGAGRIAAGANPARAFDRATRTLSFVYQSSLPPEAYGGLDFGNVPLPTFSTDGQQSGLPGNIIFFPHTFVAGSDGVVTFSTTAQSDPNLTGWAETLFLDGNLVPGSPGQPDSTGDGVFTPEHDTAITEPITVTAGQTIKILVKQFIPVEAPHDARNLITVTADFTYTGSDHADPAQSLLSTQLQRKDLTIVGEGALQLVKKVDKEQAKPGEKLVYTLTYLNNGPTPLTTVVIHDTTPDYTVFSDAPAPVIPTGLDGELTIDIEKPGVGATGPLKWTFNGSLPPGVTGEVIFEVKVQGGSEGTPPPAP